MYTREAIAQISNIALMALGESGDIWLFSQPLPDALSVDDDEYEYEVYGDDYWPLDLSREYEDASTAAQRATVGCKAIDRYLEEKAL